MMTDTKMSLLKRKNQNLIVPQKIYIGLKVKNLTLPRKNPEDGLLGASGEQEEDPFDANYFKEILKMKITLQTLLKTLERLLLEILKTNLSHKKLRTRKIELVSEVAHEKFKFILQFIKKPKTVSKAID